MLPQIIENTFIHNIEGKETHEKSDRNNNVVAQEHAETHKW